MEYQSRIVINASGEQVFNAISNPQHFSHFDPSCLRLEGTIKRGQKIQFYSRLHANKPLKMRISVLVKNQKMVWVWSLPFNLFKRERSFSIFAKDDFTTEFKIAENYSGILLPLFRKKIPNMQTEFQLFTKGLKKFLESR